MLNKQQKIYTLLLLLSILLISVNLVAVPNTMNFQGALKDANGEPVNDTRIMEFRMYPDSTGSSVLWNETHYSVEISEGIFSVELGTNNAFTPNFFNNNDELYITFLLGGEEMSPRQKLISVPYARKAEIATHLDGSLDTVYVNKVGPDTIVANNPQGALNIENVASSGKGVKIIEAGDGLFVLKAGNPSAQIPSNSPEGLEVVGSEGNGVYVGQADEYGILIRSANYSGVYIDSTADDGVNVQNSAADGFSVIYAGDNGYYVYAAGDPYMTSYSIYNNGFQVAGAEDYGLYVGYAGRSGVYVDTTDYCGLKVNAAEDYGVYISEAGNDGGYFKGDDDGIYCRTTSATNEWGLYTPDKIYGSNVSSKTISTHVKHTGSQTLEPGDLVSIAGGYEKNVLDDEDETPLINVKKASSSSSEAVFGVVEYKVKIREEIQEPKDGETRSDKSFRYTEGDVMPGEYLSVIVFGPTDVKVDSRSQIEVGQKLTVSEQEGTARNINDNDNWRVGILGKALENSNGSDKLKVFVNCK